MPRACYFVHQFGDGFKALSLADQAFCDAALVPCIDNPDKKSEVQVLHRFLPKFGRESSTEGAGLDFTPTWSLGRSLSKLGSVLGRGAHKIRA